MARRLPGDSHGRQPDWGKPTVRDDKGGLGKHGYGGIVNPPCNRKSGTGNPPPKVRAPEFYPDFVPLAAIRDPALVASSIAQTLGIQEKAGQVLLDSLRESLQDTQIL